MGIEHVVVHGSKPARFRAGTGQFEAVEPRGATRGSLDESAASQFRITVEKLGPKDERELRRDPGILCTAPSAPMKLHKPRFRGKASKPNWGIPAVGADRSELDGAGITIAVLDTGIDESHPAFAGCDVRVKNFTSEAANDLDGHGTHCAGTIFGRDVNGERIGVARGVTRALIGKVLGAGGGTSKTIIKAIAWAAENGAHIISLSLGMDFPGLVRLYKEDGYPVELATSLALRGYRSNIELFAAVVDYQTKLALGEGRALLFVAASGNESRRQVRPDFTIAVAPPAAADGMISVGALEPGAAGLVAASYSNIGGLVSAPGSQIVSARAGGGLAAMSGTSMATPHVAGVAALWAQQLVRAKRLTTRALMTAVEGKATMRGIDSAMTTDDVGAGVVQAPEA